MARGFNPGHPETDRSLARTPGRTGDTMLLSTGTRPDGAYREANRAVSVGHQRRRRPKVDRARSNCGSKRWDFVGPPRIGRTITSSIRRTGGLDGYRHECRSRAPRACDRFWVVRGGNAAAFEQCGVPTGCIRIRHDAAIGSRPLSLHCCKSMMVNCSTNCESGAADEAARRKIMVENPALLYGY